MSNNNYNIDTKYLNFISQMQSKKLNENISKRKKEEIKADICTIKEIIAAKEGNLDFFSCDDEFKKIYTIESAKEDFIAKAIKEYKFIGEDFIMFIIDLYESNILHYIKSKELKFDNNMDEVRENTLNLYSKYSNSLGNHVSNMLKKNSIQIINDAKFSSFHGHLFATGEELFVVDKKDYPFILSHEAFHGIEAQYNLVPNRLYWELGAILFETLYIDEEFNKKTPNSNKFYCSRVNDIAETLEELYNYFNIILELKEKNFKVSNVEFFDILSKHLNLEKDADIINYLAYDGLYSKLEAVCYTASFIKAIVLRKLVYFNKNKGFYELNKVLSKKTFDFDTSISTYIDIDEYIKEISAKQKKIKK